MTPDPSEQEIRTACESLQQSWSDREKLARRLWMPHNGTLVRPNVEKLEPMTVMEGTFGVKSGRAA